MAVAVGTVHEAPPFVVCTCGLKPLQLLLLLSLPIKGGFPPENDENGIAAAKRDLFSRNATPAALLTPPPALFWPGGKPTPRSPPLPRPRPRSSREP